MKRALTILFSLAAVAHAQFAVMHTNGVVTSPTNLTIQQSSVSGLSNAMSEKLGFNPTNGQVQWTNTNALTFTNRPLLKGVNTTNIPALRWDTSDGLGYGSIFAFSRAHATNLWPPEQAQTNWSQLIWGVNVEPTADGSDRRVVNTNIGAVFWAMENEWNAPVASTSPVSEVYLNTTDRGGKTVRGWGVFASQTNSDFGSVIQNYPLSIDTTKFGFFNAQFALTVQANVPGGGSTALLRNSATNSGSYAELQMVSSGGTALILQKQNRFDLFANNLSYGNIIQALTNGVVIGSSSFVSSASARVQLGGDTRVDGAISFNTATNAATTRTNLGLGNGITTNVSSGTLQFSNGILVGHTP